MTQRTKNLDLKAASQGAHDGMIAAPSTLGVRMAFTLGQLVAPQMEVDLREQPALRFDVIYAQPVEIKSSVKRLVLPPKVTLRERFIRRALCFRGALMQVIVRWKGGGDVWCL